MLHQLAEPFLDQNYLSAIPQCVDMRLAKFVFQANHAHQVAMPGKRTRVHFMEFDLIICWKHPLKLEHVGDQHDPCAEGVDIEVVSDGVDTGGNGEANPAPSRFNVGPKFLRAFGNDKIEMPRISDIIAVSSRIGRPFGFQKMDDIISDCLGQPASKAISSGFL